MWQRTYERYDYAPARSTGIGGVIYVILGLLVAGAQNYFEHLSTLGSLLSAILAVVLWPLLLFGIDVRVG